MNPAARTGDKTAHATQPLTPASPATGGSLNVLIGDRPAWRATLDVHVCTLTTGTVPHVGGMVAKGSLTVLINDVPAARMGDTIVEAGPPNAITEGCTTVLIGG
jgi:uncharacterized Zn-binding protein involved in type VI secretion